jgi:hypothetical protein
MYKHPKNQTRNSRLDDSKSGIDRLMLMRAVESAVETGLKRVRRLRQAVLQYAFEGTL